MTSDSVWKLFNLHLVLVEWDENYLQRKMHRASLILVFEFLKQSKCIEATCN